MNPVPPTSSGGPVRMLIVEDEAIVARDLENSLGRLGYEIAGIAMRGEDAIAQAEAKRPDMVLMDIRLQGAMDGVDAADEIWRRYDVPTVFLTAFADDETVARAKAAGGFGYLVKPFESRALRATIELALARANEARVRGHRFFEVFSLLGDGAALLDSNGRIARLNPPAAELLGRSEADLVEAGVELRSILEEGEGGARLRRANGELVSLRVCRVPIGGANDGAELVIFREPARGLLPEQRLRRREVTELLRQLIVGVANGVANPLFVISAQLDLLALDLGPVDTNVDVRALLHAQVERIRALLEYLAQFAGSENARLWVVPVVPLVQGAVNRHETLAHTRGLTLEVESTAAEADAVIECDGEAIQVALDHLLSNAIAFSPSASTVKIRIVATRGIGSSVAIQVEDHGPGIPSEDLLRVFSPFFTRRSGGTGLGLAIVRRVVDDHGGTVRAENLPEAGARLTVRLPLRR